MNVVQLMASPFVGGPERVVLGLARALPATCRTVFLSFAEGGKARPLLEHAARDGFEAVELRSNFPRVFRAAREVADHLRRVRADVLCCNGYKPDILGWMAARRAGVPVVSIAHGWTAATWRVRFNEWIDRLVLRRMDAVVCVSVAQAEKVRRAGVRPDRVMVIHNAIDAARFDNPDPEDRRRLLALFPQAPTRVVAAAGRLSPEKGFDQLIDAAALVTRADTATSFVLFGHGPLRDDLARRVRERGLEGRFVLAGFRTDLERLLPWCDVAVSSSHTEGLPVNVLEAQAAGVPVVATAVGGTPEVIEDGVGGYLVPPGDPAALARRITDVLHDEARRRVMGANGRRRVSAEFTCAAQAERYLQLFESFRAVAPASRRCGLAPAGRRCH
jgi:glycosyltransferase involved in cell wall biosynthesis